MKHFKEKKILQYAAVFVMVSLIYVMWRLMLPNEKGITRARGKWFDGPYGSKMIPIFHPSYLLRNDSREKGSPKWLMWQDIKEIKRVYDTLK